MTLAAGVIAATVLQFVGALAVREYAKALWVKECREEERAVTYSVEQILERGMANEERQRVLDEERRREEANLEEWGFGGLPRIEEEREGINEKGGLI